MFSSIYDKPYKKQRSTLNNRQKGALETINSKMNDYLIIFVIFIYLQTLSFIVQIEEQMLSANPSRSRITTPTKGSFPNNFFAKTMTNFADREPHFLHSKICKTFMPFTPKNQSKNNFKQPFFLTNQLQNRQNCKSTNNSNQLKFKHNLSCQSKYFRKRIPMQTKTLIKDKYAISPTKKYKIYFTRIENKENKSISLSFSKCAKQNLVESTQNNIKNIQIQKKVNGPPFLHKTEPHLFKKTKMNLVINCQIQPEDLRRNQQNISTPPKLQFNQSKLIGRKNNTFSPIFLKKVNSNNQTKAEKLNKENLKDMRNTCKQFYHENVNQNTTDSSNLRFFLKKKKQIQNKNLNISQFLVRGCQGQGRFGKVYQAIHKKTGYIVALKIIRKDLVKKIKKQFLNELKIQFFLDHPNIAKLYGFFQDDSNIYLIQQYLEEGTLYKIIKNKLPLTEEIISQKLREICQAIKYMHFRDILHRDIKPQNIVMTLGVCKICDFGSSVYSKQRRNTRCGTLDYACPAVVRGQSYSKQIDLWALGVLTFELLTGKTPFYHISQKQTISNIRNCDFQMPKQISKSAYSFLTLILQQKGENKKIEIDQLLKEQFLQKTDQNIL